jgi:hypothetical protein
MINYDPHWTAYLTALLTPVTAGIAIYIAYIQAKTARNKLKFDLFERRFKVYEAASDLRNLIVSNSSCDQHSYGKLLSSTLNARWLFCEATVNYVKTLQEKAFELHNLNAPNDELSDADRQKKSDLVRWFNAQQNEMENVFDRDLKLNQ